MKNFQFVILPEYSASSSRWDVQVDLSGIRYKLNVSWNSQMEGWVLCISDMKDNLILGGVRLSVGSYLLRKYRASCPGLPPGEIWLLDTTETYGTAELTRDNFNTRFKLCYGTWEE
jgi:hypothetical protein